MFKYSTWLIVSFADRDMIMRHFGFGIGHVNSMACQRNNEDDDFGSDSDSQAESDAMDLMPDS
jgi:hypothetical protein